MIGRIRNPFGPGAGGMMPTFQLKADAFGYSDVETSSAKGYGH